MSRWEASGDEDAFLFRRNRAGKRVRIGEVDDEEIQPDSPVDVAVETSADVLVEIRAKEAELEALRKRYHELLETEQREAAARARTPARRAPPPPVPSVVVADVDGPRPARARVDLPVAAPFPGTESDAPTEPRKGFFASVAPSQGNSMTSLLQDTGLGFSPSRGDEPDEKRRSEQFVSAIRRIQHDAQDQQ